MKRTIEKIVDFAVRVAEPEMIILFGSMADERDNLFSDVDLLVISENTHIKEYVRSKIESYSSELSLQTDVLIYSRKEIENESQNSNSFITAVLKSGKVVYDRTCNVCSN